VAARWASPLTQQQVKVLGHDHIAYDHEVIPAAHAFENFQQQIAIPPLSQQRQPTITAGGDEVEISRAIIATEFVGHPQAVARNAWFFCDD
jgi:hypothetical protein